MRKAVFLVLVSLMFTSCFSTMFAPAEYVPAMDSLEVIEKTISNYETSGEYLKKFCSKDKREIVMNGLSMMINTFLWMELFMRISFMN